MTGMLGPVHLRVDLCEGYGGARLPVHQAPQPGLALDDAVGNPHLAAQGRQEDHELEDSVSVQLSEAKATLLFLKSRRRLITCSLFYVNGD